MNWIEWVETPQHKNVVYHWGNNTFSLGYGRTHLENGNCRVSPLLSFKDVKTKKDSGKTFYALFLAKLSDNKPKLFYIPDDSIRTSYISSELEELVKRGGKFVRYNGKTMSKSELAHTIIIPTISNKFGINSTEAMLSRLASSDADLWGRFYGDSICSQAMDNIMEAHLWADR